MAAWWRDHRVWVYGIVVAGLAASATAAYKLWALTDDYRTERLKREEDDMQTHTATWVDATGITRTVSTVRNAGESDDDWAARHDASVLVALDKWPLPTGGGK